MMAWKPHAGVAHAGRRPAFIYADRFVSSRECDLLWRFSIDNVADEVNRAGTERRFRVSWEFCPNVLNDKDSFSPSLEEKPCEINEEGRMEAPERKSLTD
jgi:hypothetical protein